MRLGIYSVFVIVNDVRGLDCIEGIAARSDKGLADVGLRPEGVHRVRGEAAAVLGVMVWTGWGRTAS